MALVQITIRTDNAAFSFQPGAEVARILRRLADDFEQDGEPHSRKLMDYNGNAVGSVTVTGQSSPGELADDGIDYCSEMGHSRGCPDQMG